MFRLREEVGVHDSYLYAASGASGATGTADSTITEAGKPDPQSKAAANGPPQEENHEKDTYCHRDTAMTSSQPARERIVDFWERVLYVLLCPVLAVICIGGRFEDVVFARRNVSVEIC